MKSQCIYSFHSEASSTCYGPPRAGDTAGSKRKKNHFLREVYILLGPRTLAASILNMHRPLLPLCQLCPVSHVDGTERQLRGPQVRSHCPVGGMHTKSAALMGHKANREPLVPEFQHIVD